MNVLSALTQFDVKMDAEGGSPSKIQIGACSRGLVISIIFNKVNLISEAEPLEMHPLENTPYTGRLGWGDDVSAHWVSLSGEFRVGTVVCESQVRK